MRPSRKAKHPDTSLLNDKHGPIGRALRGIRPEHRELWFIFGQLSASPQLLPLPLTPVYSIVFMVPAALLFITSSRWTNIALILVFWVAAWNGASFYVEVFGRKFERELDKLRGEMEALSGASSKSTSAPSTPFSGASSAHEYSLEHSPLVLPASSQTEPSPLTLEKKEDGGVSVVDRPKSE